MTQPAQPGDYLLLTCEHAGNSVPKAYADLFRGAEDVLESHRGWDRGALTLARSLARTLDRPLLAVTWSRLFVEANRAPTNPRIWSRFTASLPKDERERILARYWRPHRGAVERAVAAAARSGRVVHVAVHSFVPELDGEVRNADIALLYDSRRAGERDFCRRWNEVMHRLEPRLRLRCNYPYRGLADGLTTWMRRLHPDERYIGIELEINQALVDAPGWRRLQRLIAESLREVIDANAHPARADRLSGTASKAQARAS